MTTEEKLIRDIDTLRNSLELITVDLAKGLANPETVIEHGRWCLKELADLLDKLEKLKKGQ